MRILIAFSALIGMTLGQAGSNGFAVPPALVYPKSYPYEYYPQYRSAVCNPSEPIKYPKSADEVQAIVKDAISRGKKVKAFGSHHSASDIICTDGIPIDMTGVKGTPRMNEDFSVTVGAGTYLRDVGAFLHANGRALKMTPAYGGITIGGAIGTGAHGSSIKWKASISEHVVAVKIIDGFGEYQNITDPTELRAFRVHLGLLGIVVEVTLETYPEFKLKVHNYVESDEIFTNGTALQMLQEGDSVFFYWYPRQEKVIVSYGTVEDVSVEGNCFSNDHVPSTSQQFQAYGTAALEAAAFNDDQPAMDMIEEYFARTLYDSVPDFVPIYTEDNMYLKNPGIGFSHDMLAADCNINRKNTTAFNSCPWYETPRAFRLVDQEISLDVNDMANFVKDVKDIVSKSHASFPLQGILMRFSQASTILMSTSAARNSCHFEWYIEKRWNEYEDSPASITAYQTMMQNFAFKYSGRSHWGKTGLFYHTKDMIARKIGPGRRDAFKKSMDKYDPNGIYRNKFAGRFLGTSTAMDSDPLVKHCALFDDCICSKNSDCAANQICTSLPGYASYRACQNIPNLLADITNSGPSMEAASFAEWAMTYSMSSLPAIPNAK